MTGRDGVLLGMVQNFNREGGDEDGSDVNWAKMTAEDSFPKSLDIGNPLVQCDDDRRSQVAHVLKDH
jgi:hypothetical protein